MASQTIINWLPSLCMKKLKKTIFVINWVDDCSNGSLFLPKGVHGPLVSYSRQIWRHTFFKLCVLGEYYDEYGLTSTRLHKSVRYLSLRSAARAQNYMRHQDFSLKGYAEPPWAIFHCWLHNSWEYRSDQWWSHRYICFPTANPVITHS